MLWLSAAGLALLLPEAARAGLWLPLHLALAGAVSVSISGNMLAFVSALTASPDPARVLILAQFALVNLGAALAAAGYPTRHPGLVAWGGGLFAAGIAVLAGDVLGRWRRALFRRHRVPVFLYGTAVACMLAGAGLGAALGSGAIQDPGAFLGLRQAHMTLNVLGWASVTIAGTLVTFLPTVLRVRMPVRHGGVTAAMLAGGVVVLAGGLAARLRPVSVAGALAYWVGAVGLGWMTFRVARAPRRWPISVTAKHLVAGVGWFLGGTTALAANLAVPGGSFDAFREVFLVAFVGGFVIQTLLGAWQYLLPMGRLGHPDERRRFLAAVEYGGNLQVGAVNLGLVLLVLRSAGMAPEPAGAAGAVLALGGGAAALGKAWLFPLLARLPATARRSARLWPFVQDREMDAGS